MPWKELGEDRKVEVIVDPDFRGDLIGIAAQHPIWIIETPGNAPKIEASWRVGDDMNLCYINKYQAPDPSDREESLVLVFDAVHLHHGYAAGGSYDGLIVEGLRSTTQVEEKLAKLGFEITQTTADGFVALGTLSEDVGMRRFRDL